ncbi:MAG: hypothetical protein Q4F50_04605 [Bacteroides sp.]|uniref:hypothetical protein n=1 Tax=Bacteroides sp. TaxID=29523 RepID=UPI0026E08094|nr:hypothetical protein [Bacteroides sp.]MDO5419328.1 hypothetical protein [Bacteroides sp.]
MKKIGLLLIGVLTLFACEQEELDNFVKSDVNQVYTRTASSISDFNPITELSEIPVNIINVGNTRYQYLSANANNDNISLAAADDGSLRQQWYIRPNLVIVGGRSSSSANMIVLPKVGEDYPMFENYPFVFDQLVSPKFQLLSNNMYEIVQYRSEGGLGGKMYGGYLQAKNNTSNEVKYKSDSGSSTAQWQIVPVGEYDIVKMEYEKSTTYNDFIEQQDLYVNGAVVADVPTETHHSLDVTKTIESTSSFSEAKGTNIQSQSSFGFSLGLGEASKVHIGFNGEISNTVSSTETLTWGKEKKETMSVSQTFSTTIPPHTPCRIEVLWRTFKTSITYVATLEKVDGIAKGKRFKIKGNWKGVVESDLYYNIYSMKDNKLIATDMIQRVSK